MRADDRQISRLYRLLTLRVAPVSSQPAIKASSSEKQGPAMVSFDEKKGGDAELGQVVPPRSRLRFLGPVLRLALIVCCLIILGPTLNLRNWLYFGREFLLSEDAADVCPQVAPISPFTHSSLLTELEETFATTDFKLGAYESLGGAIRIPCVNALFCAQCNCYSRCC